MNILIVESPSQAKSINKYLGSDFKVLASVGHVRDLSAKNDAIDTENDFQMKWETSDRGKKVIKDIANAAQFSENLYLATDPDREGEAITAHVKEIIDSKKNLKNKPTSRITFHQITKSAIVEAINNPKDLSIPLIEAQMARRSLDYLVGFQLSPLLWRKIKPGLSAGRVQSPALRMIVEREEEIEKFQSQEYWSISANLDKKRKKFSSKLCLKSFKLT